MKPYLRITLQKQDPCTNLPRRMFSCEIANCLIFFLVSGQISFPAKIQRGKTSYRKMMKLKDKCFKTEDKEKKEITVRVEREECPDGGYGWIICIAAAIIQFIILGIHNNFGILYTYFMKDLDADPADTGESSPSSQRVVQTVGNSLVLVPH